MFCPSIPYRVALVLLLATPTVLRGQPASSPPAAPTAAEAEKAIRDALTQKASLKLVDTPLGEAAKIIQDKFHIPVVIDQAALEAEGLDRQIPVSLDVSNVTLRSILSLLLEPLQLATVVKNETLIITTRTEAPVAIVVQVYPVADLLATTTVDDRQVPDFDSLIDLLTTVVHPDTWDEVGGDGSISCFEAARALVVCQSDEVQRRIGDLLAALQSIPAVDSADRDDSASPAAVPVSGAVPAAIAQALQQRISLEGEMSVQQLAKTVSRQMKIPALVDHAALEAEGLDAAMPVSCDGKDRTLASTFRLVLEPVQLTYVVRHEVLMITSIAEETTELVEKVYPVLDLVRVHGEAAPESSDFDTLIETITTTIHPDTWDEVGGDGSIAPMGLKAALVISQTRQVHDEIASLLSRLRSVKAEQKVPPLPRPDPAQILTRVYKLQGDEIEPKDLEEMVRAIFGDGVFVKAIKGKLIVVQRRDVHAQIEKFLRQLGSPPSYSGSGMFSVP